MWFSLKPSNLAHNMKEFSAIAQVAQVAQVRWISSGRLLKKVMPFTTNSWLVWFMENPHENLDDDWGSTYFWGNLQFGSQPDPRHAHWSQPRLDSSCLPTFHAPKTFKRSSRSSPTALVAFASWCQQTIAVVGEMMSNRQILEYLRIFRQTHVAFDPTLAHGLEFKKGCYSVKHKPWRPQDLELSRDSDSRLLWDLPVYSVYCVS